MDNISDIQRFNEVLAKYGLGELSDEPKRMRGASSNINFALETAQGKYFCRMRRGFDQQDVLLHKVLTYLTDKEFSTASLLHTVDGETYVQQNNLFYEIFDFIQGDELEKINQEQFASMGSLIAQFHECMQCFECPYPFEYFVSKQSWNNYPHLQRQAQFIEYSSRDMLNKEGAIELREKILENLLLTRQKMEQITTEWEHIEPTLTHTFIHGDYHIGNVLFREDKATYICDFDFVMPAERIFDIVTAFVWYESYYGGWDISEPNTDFFKPYMNFLSNYNQQTTQKLTLEELKALILDMQRLLLLYGSKAAMHRDDLEGMLNWLMSHLNKVEWLDSHREKFENAFIMATSL